MLNQMKKNLTVRTMADFEKELTGSFRVMKSGELVKGMIHFFGREMSIEKWGKK